MPDEIFSDEITEGHVLFNDVGGAEAVAYQLMQRILTFLPAPATKEKILAIYAECLCVVWDPKNYLKLETDGGSSKTRWFDRIPSPNLR